MPEESTFRKYACPKLKLSRLLLDNLFRILEQNLPALEELNSKKHTVTNRLIFTKLRNCAKLEFCKTRNRAILREMTFANDCANCCFFAQRKKKFAFRSAKIAQKFCEWKPYVHSVESN